MKSTAPDSSGRGPIDRSLLLKAVIEKSRGLSLVWLIPLLALLIGIWLAYKTLSDEGPTITIHFKEAPGLEAGKSKIKYKDVEVGVVETVLLNEDLSRVMVTAKMEKHVASHLGKETAFWVVKPQLGLSGVSGLDTLMAGNYIGVDFSSGNPVREFQGNDHPPRINPETPGRSFTLMAENAGPLKYGTPIYFRDIQVGQVVDVALADNHQGVQAEIFVEAPYHQLIEDDSRFWQINGVDFSMGAQGVNLKVGSLMSLLGGGIGFESPSLNNPEAKPADAGAKFRLHKDLDAIAEGSYRLREPYLLHFDDSVRGLNVGAPVELKGIRVGTVTDIRLDIDFKTQKVRIPVIAEVDPERLIPPGADNELSLFIKAHQAEIDAGRHPGIEKMVEKGLRARLKTGSLLTGQLYVDVDFYPESAPKKLIYGGLHPEIPTLPSVVDELQKNITEVVASLKRLPLDKMGQELLGTLQGSNRLLNTPELRDTITAMNFAMNDIRQLTQTADKQIVNLAASVEKAMSSTIKVLEQVQPGAPMAVDMSNALEELAASARSIRVLTEYIERHPEALLQGKGVKGGK